MKKIILCLLLTLGLPAAKSQLPDSLQRSYNAANTFRDKGQVITNYVLHLPGSPPEQLKILLSQLSYFTNKKDEAGIGYTKLFIGISFVKMSDYSESLKYGIDALKIFEEMQDTFALLKTYTVIGNSYLYSQNIEESLKDWEKGLPVARNYDLHYYLTYLDKISICFNNENQPDSAMPYSQEALKIAYNRKDSIEISSCLSEVAETYLVMNQNEIARVFLRQSISFLRNTNNFLYSYSGAMGLTLNGISQSFLNTSQYDSSLFYARQALTYDYPYYLTTAQSSYELIYESFEKENKQDSSNKYFRLATEIRDSLFSDEKSRNIQSQKFKEEIRQQELETQKEALALQHKQNIENALIAFGIISFIMLFVLLSRNLITNTNLIRFLGVVALLMVFEFINLLIHPFLEEKTNHSQMLMLLLLVGLAALLVPLHHKLEKWTVTKLVEKNKARRLAAAKRTIEKLQGKEEIADKE